MKQTLEQVAVIQKKLIELNQNKLFINKDYLLWLWFIAENHKSISCLKTKDSKGLKINIWIDNKIVFYDSLGQGHESHLKGGTPSHSLESTIALKNGKVIKEIRLGIQIDGVGEYTFSLQMNNLNPKNIILPSHSSNTENSEQDLIDLRLYQIEILYQILDEVFSQFLKERSSSNWKEKFLLIKAWISSRHNNKTTKYYN